MKEKSLIIKIFFKILIIIGITEVFIMTLFFYLNVSKFLQIILDPIFSIIISIPFLLFFIFLPLKKSFDKKFFLERAINELLKNLSFIKGDKYFKNLALNLYNLFKIRYVIVGKKVGDEIHPFIFLLKGQEQNVKKYSLKNTVCEDVLKKGSLYLSQDVYKKFPKTTELLHEKIEGYIGVRFQTHDNTFKGVICCLSDVKLNYPKEIIEKLFSILSIRTSAELERTIYENEQKKIFQLREKLLETNAEELKKTFKIREEFLTLASHEFKTPLTSIHESITIVLNEITGKINKEQREILNIGKSNIIRFRDLIENFLNFEKLKTGKIKIEKEKENYLDVVLESEKTMLLEAKLKGIEINVKANDNLPKIFIDKNKMIQVLENLLQNAIKFSTKGPIIIEVKLDGDYIKTSITDRGIGIKKENFSKLFLPFETIFDEIKKEKGTGLGLSIVKQIISDHKGTIEVESEISKGTTFSFNLPIDNK